VRPAVPPSAEHVADGYAKIDAGDRLAIAEAAPGRYLSGDPDEKR